MVSWGRFWRLGAEVAVAAVFLALVFVPWNNLLVSKVSLGEMLALPSWQHPLGTDAVGRDLLVRIAAAFKESILPLWLAVIVATVGGGVTAAVIIDWGAGRRGGALLLGTQVVATALGSIPVGIAAFAWAVFSGGTGILPVAAAVSLLFAVRTLQQVLDLYRHDNLLGFWQAHELLGGSRWQRLWRYGFLGQWRRPLLDSLGFHLLIALTIESSLSYLGFGVQEPQASLGNILAAHFSLYLKGDWYILLVIVAALWLAAAFPSALIKLVRRQLADPRN